MKPYAERDKEFKVFPWPHAVIQKVKLAVWLGWLKEVVFKSKVFDSEFESMIYRLNARGFITHNCCAGHDGGRGYIVFFGSYTQPEIEELLSPYYLKSIKYTSSEERHALMEERFKFGEAFMREKYPDYVDGGRVMLKLPMTVVSFQGVGQAKRKKKTKIQGKQLVLIGK